MDGDELSRVEEYGRIDLARYGGADRLARELPSRRYQLARLRFGTVGPSNHFVELQQVEEVFDPAAEALGVREGQLSLQYQAGGGGTHRRDRCPVRPPPALPEEDLERR